MSSRENMFYWQSDRPYSAKEIKEIFLDRKQDYSRKDLEKVATQAVNEEVELSQPIDFGSVNIVCPFKSVSGLEGIVRAHPNQVQNQYFYVEKKVMEKADAAGIPVPQTLVVDTSRKLVSFDYMITTKIPGKVMQEDINTRPSAHNKYLFELGKYLGMLHKISTNQYGFFDNSKAKKGELVGLHDSNKEHFGAALDLDRDFYQSNAGWFDERNINKALDILISNIDIAECEEPTLIHNDIADWNTVVNDNAVTGILDWDECFSGDPVFEFATLSLFYSPTQMEKIIEGYKETNSLPADYDKKFDLYVLRYIVNKSKISIKKLQFIEKESTRNRFNLAKDKLNMLVEVLG